MSELPKTFDPASIETRWYAHWEAAGAFRPERQDAEPFTIVMPPPNVTGSLHVGHALDNTLPDILVRWNRMRGRDALWVPGMDHAGIATQMVVERNLASQGLERRAMGREAFLNHVWEWKEQSGGAIVRQLRRLGASCDWSAERFTMDEGLSRAVIRVFVDMHRRGLIYRDKRLVNWDPALGTAISDLEVEPREVRGHFWHLRYPLVDGGHIAVATTRPETMLADMAVAVHPDDARYRDVVGRMVRLPVTGRLIPVIADEHADPELGSGAVKITPGHDFNDFEVGVRAGFKPADMLNMLDAGARIVQTADGLVPAAMIGLEREAARAAVIAALEAEGALERVEERVIQVPHGDRSGAVIEPWLTDQWYVDAKRLAGPALEAVADGRIEIVPDQWRKTWNQWLENIQPWCVSRQLWWGHRIPAWYADDGRVFVAESEAAARAEAGNVPLRQDEDVLDTWFSSALWPFATLGWPDDMERVKRHYPGDVLISGFDILFFWDARMAMQGLEFMGDVPWRRLYLHGLVRDAQGQKMSKSKGNTIDPIGLIDRFGADALRFTLAAMEAQGRDIKLDEARVAGYRNFATKLWNASRFAQASGAVHPGTGPAPAAAHPVNQWVIAGCHRMVAAVDKALEELRFDAAADAVYQFAWGRFCDWYVELAKPLLADDATRDETRSVLGWALDRLLAALHPFMPFVTEELWHALAERETDLILARWPEAGAVEDDGEVDWLIALVSAVRSARTGLNVAPGARLALHGDAAGVARAMPHAAALARLARVEAVTDAPVPPGGAAAIVVPGAAFRLALGGVVDLEAERARLEKGAAAARKEAAGLAGRLSSAAFVERAKPEAVEKARADHAARVAEAERLEAALAGLA